MLGMLGLIILVIGVNATFIWFATHNTSTLVDREYRTKDRKTGAEVISELSAMQALGWRTAIKKPKAIVMNDPTLYEISVEDRDGRPVSGSMEVESYRAADASRDFGTRFKEVSLGTYQGFIAFPLKGYWELRIHIKRGEDELTVVADRFQVAESR
jgi:nitrogen fixation protein FixH